MLLLGLSVLTTSCEKMDGGKNSGASSISEELLGKWIKTKTDYSFNGKVVATRKYDKPEEYTFYDNGSCFIYYPKLGYSTTVAYVYDKSSNVIYLDSKYDILEVSNNVAKLSYQRPMSTDVNGVKIETYEGIDIYYIDDENVYYYVKNGNKIRARHYDYGEDGDWWCDTQIIYFERAK